MIVLLHATTVAAAGTNDVARTKLFLGV